ncbi:MAG: hypothetical protein M3Q86_00380 [Verrucomicrobiota bacterium]|nr:hypothetical protein [Verrucomicrobiota bacterium]
MQSANRPTSAKNGAADILFQCDHCQVALMIEKSAAGLTVNCQRCGKPTTVPHFSVTGFAKPAPAQTPPAKLADLQRHLKENESQRTEINGYINQLSIQLHRWQLRLQTLNERNKQLVDEMAELRSADRPQVTS